MKIILFFTIILTSTMLIASSKSEYNKLSKRYHVSKSKEWRKLKSDFLKHGDKYSKNSIAAKSYYTSANLSFKLYKISKKKKDLDFTIKYFDKVCKKYKTSLSDDACFVLYSIYSQYRKDDKKSKYYAKYIVEHYKKGDQYKKAKAFLKKKYPLEQSSIKIKKTKVKETKVKKIKSKKANTYNQKKIKIENTKLNKQKAETSVMNLSKNKKVYTIIIDPGHGGYDPGAKGKLKKAEKNLVLDVALKLEKLLKKNKKYKVILTRRTDKFLSLDARTDIANNNNGDLFISIHINALKAKKYYGIETFYLNLAADNYSRRLERVENAEQQKKITDLQFILADLLKKANTKDSIGLANTIQSSLVFSLRRKYKNIRNLGVKNAMFYVLLDTKMPSVLVELGFITNKKEEKRLNNKQYQNLLAKSLKKGIDNYFSKTKKGK